MRKKILLFGIVLLLFASFGYAQDLGHYTSCSDNSEDYWLYDSNGWSYSSNTNVNYQSDYSSGNYIVFYENYKFTGSTGDDPGLRELSANSTQYGGNGLQCQSNTWVLYGTSSGVTCSNNQDYNVSLEYNLDTNNVLMYSNGVNIVNGTYSSALAGVFVRCTGITCSTTGHYAWESSVCSASVATPTNTTNTTTPAYEGDQYTYTLTLENYNLTSSTTADLLYNGSYYAGTINHINNSYVEFYTTSPAAPVVYNNNTNVNLNWNVTLKYANGTTRTDSTNTETQAIYWNLSAYPRVNVTAYDVIAGTYINGFSLNDSTRTFTTTGNEIYFYISGEDTSHAVTISNSSYEQKTANLNFTAGVMNTYQFDLYTYNSINFTFYNEVTNTLVTDNITVEFISDLYTYNYTAQNGVLYVDLLSPSDYTIRYQSGSYGRLRSYLFTLTNLTHSELDLYLIPNANSTETTVTLYNEVTLNKIEGGVVYLQRYFPTTNEYKTVAMYESDVGGKAYFDIEHDNELYKFIVHYPWKTIKETTNPLYVSASTLNLYISLEDDVTSSFYNELGIAYSITYDSTNEEFDLTYTDTAEVASTYCLDLKKYGDYSLETINTTCGTSSTGTLSVSGLTENKTYYGVFRADVGGSDTMIASAWKDVVPDKLNAGSLGVFMSIMLIMVMVFISALHVYALILGSAGIVFAKLLGVLSLGWGTVILVVIGSIILSIFIQNKK